MDPSENLKFYSVDTTDVNKAIQEIGKLKSAKIKLYKDSKTKLLSSQERSWLKKRGKKHYIDFDDTMRNELRKYFISMDSKGSKNIGADELLDPLIALGLVENRAQVQALIDSVDTDKSGKIEFEEFLNILKNEEGNSPMFKLFREMIRGRLVEDANVLPFNLVVSNYRRKMILDSIMNDDPARKSRGDKVYKAFYKQHEATIQSRKIT